MLEFGAPSIDACEVFNGAIGEGAPPANLPRLPLEVSNYNYICGQSTKSKILWLDGSTVVVTVSWAVAHRCVTGSLALVPNGCFTATNQISLFLTVISESSLVAISKSN